MKASRRDFSHLATASSSTLRVSSAPEPYGTRPVIGTRSSSTTGSSPSVLAAVTASARSSYSDRSRRPSAYASASVRSTMSRSASEARIGANSGDLGSWSNSRHSSEPVTASW